MDFRKENIISRWVTILIKSIAEAPNYPAKVKMLKMTKAIIVEKGMVGGAPSVDLQCEDGDGNEYLIMTTGNIMDGIAGAIKGVIARTEDGTGK